VSSLIKRKKTTPKQNPKQNKPYSPPPPPKHQPNPTPPQKNPKPKGASLKFTVLNPKGRVWLMVAGGGASVIYADTVGDLGYAHVRRWFGVWCGW
jgi:succinyl-CoA synthetase beta subunit